MLEGLKVGVSVATPLGALGFLIWGVLCAYYWRLKHDQKQLEAIPKNRRDHAVDTFLSRYHIDAANLTRDHKYDLIKSELGQRSDIAKWRIVAISTVTLACFGLATISYVAQTFLLHQPGQAAPSQEVSHNKASVAELPSPQIKKMADSIIFSQIEIANNLCFWSPIEKPYTVVAPIRNVSGEYWHFGGKPLETPQQTWASGSHQRFPLGSDGKQIDFAGTADPVFDITILNKSNRAVVVSRIGIRPIAAWTSPKGPTFSGKLTTFESYTLRIKEFEPGQDQWLIFPDPVYLKPDDPFRLKLRLESYCAIVPRNESVMQLLMTADDSVIVSTDIYLGFYKGS